jgi:hypothetical protein
MVLQIIISFVHLKGIDISPDGNADIFPLWRSLSSKIDPQSCLSDGSDLLYPDSLFDGKGLDEFGGLKLSVGRFRVLVKESAELNKLHPNII